MSEQAIKQIIEKNRKAAKYRRIMVLAVCGLLAFTFVVFAALMFIENYMLTVSISKPGSGKRSLALSEVVDFENPVSMLGSDRDTKLDHYTYSWLPFDIDDIDGTHSKFESYIAYTFYVKNMSADALDYEILITTKSVTKGIDEAVRIMLIENGKRTVYSKPNRETGEPEWVTGPDDPDKEIYGHSTSFEGSGLAVKKMRDVLNANEIDKFTVVVWLEGEDPECVNSVLDGKMKIDIKFTVIEA